MSKETEKTPKGAELSPQEKERVKTIRKVQSQLADLREAIQKTPTQMDEGAIKEDEDKEVTKSPVEVDLQNLAASIKEMDGLNEGATEQQKKAWLDYKMALMGKAETDPNVENLLTGLADSEKVVEGARTELKDLAATMLDDELAAGRAALGKYPTAKPEPGFAFINSIEKFVKGNPMVTKMLKSVGMTPEKFVDYMKQMAVFMFKSNPFVKGFLEFQKTGKVSLDKSKTKPSVNKEKPTTLFGTDNLVLNKKLPLEGEKSVTLTVDGNDVTLKTGSIEYKGNKYELKEGDKKHFIDTLEPKDKKDQGQLRLALEGDANKTIMLTDLLKKLAAKEPLKLGEATVSIEEVSA